MSKLKEPGDGAAQELVAVVSAILRAHFQKHPQFAALRMTPELERNGIITAMVQDLTAALWDLNSKYGREAEDASQVEEGRP